MSDNEENRNKSLFKFFSIYFWVGVVLLLITLLIQSYFKPTHFLFVSFLLFLSTIAVSFIVATLFTYTLGTKEFLEFIQKKLEDIVISRKFLRNIDTEKKEEALHAILQPSDLQGKNLYTNLEKYYEHFISDVMNVSKKNIRTHYHLDVVIDVKNNTLFSLGRVNYRLYPSEKGYLPIKVGVHDLNDSGCTSIIINPRGEKLFQVEVDKLVFNEHIDGAKMASVNLSEYDKKSDYLDVEINFIEYGHDHWLAFQFIAMQPTDGFKFTLRCEQDITIKEKMFFDMENDYNISENTDKFMSLSNFKWMQERSGLVVVVSRPESSCSC